jgi:hypothetical protein
MNIFVFMPRPDKKGENLLADLAPLIAHGSLEVFADLPSFAARVRRPKEPGSVALVYSPTHEDLNGLASLRDCLKWTRVLLALPDQGDETIALSHRLFPTYIGYVDNGLAGIVSILKLLTKERAAAPLPVVKSGPESPRP